VIKHLSPHRSILTEPFGFAILSLTHRAFHDIHQQHGLRPHNKEHPMNKIRTTIITAAIAGGSIIGIAGVTGIADAASSDAGDVAPAALIGEDGETVTTEDRAERRALRQEARAEKQQEIADVLGVSVEDLVAQKSDGATLSEIAEANGADVADVVAVIVENKTERIDAAVESGRVTAEESAEKLDGLEERVQTRVEDGRSERGDGEGRRGNRGGDATDTVTTDVDGEG